MSINTIAIKFLSFQNILQLYHWNTLSYSRHKASDELYLSLIKKIDKFIEVAQGSRDIKVKIKKHEIILESVNDNEILVVLHNFKKWIMRLNLKKETDLNNIRDEIISDVNKTLYLFTLN